MTTSAKETGAAAVNTQKRLYRSTEDRMFAGVCGGIAEYLEVDPTLVRLVFVALAFMGGPGPIIYIVLMLVVPENSGEQWKRKRDEFEEMETAAMAHSSIPVPTHTPEDYIEADESNTENESPPDSDESNSSEPSD